jgi:Predicted RNA-binding protein homologous to eukaryotic snRNP
MAFDGITIANLAYELNENILNARIYKIAQPEADELLLTLKTSSGQKRLYISASASLPLIYLTKENKPSPMTAPNFCMLLRKHIQNGRIVKISQPELERALYLDIEHLDELGDLCRKRLIVEIMGKHSNIIFCNDEGKIIDSIKHVSANVSSVREVLPGRDYFIPDTMDKANPLLIEANDFTARLLAKPMPLAKALYTSFTGISPIIAEEICHLSGIDSALPATELSTDLFTHLYTQFRIFLKQIEETTFAPAIYYNGALPFEFASLPLTHLAHLSKTKFRSISELLITYYATRNTLTRIRQKSTDLRRIVQTALERNRKKYDLQDRQIKDTHNRDKFRVYGELINTYGYGLPEDATTLETVNYYTNEPVKIPLDNTKTPAENAQKYFNKYNKQKRTFEALTTFIEETKDEVAYLESVSAALDIASSEGDLTQIKEELTQSGYIRKKHTKGKRTTATSKPLHYISSDGYHMYVGKNNMQNDYLTFDFAVGNDWWFHAKGIPGSHVIVKSNGDELPDNTFEEAGKLAAFYCVNREADKVEIDYIEKKHIKKPKGGKPGFVVYHTNYSLVSVPDIAGLEMVD